MIKELEEEKKENFLFYYTNLIDNDAIIEPTQINEIDKVLSELENKYDTINVVINTSGGNLATGHKIITILNSYYENIKFIILERCSSTGTFIALSGDEILISPRAIITPTEPQMDTLTLNSSSISTSLIRNYLDNIENQNSNVEKLDSLTFANYQATISYFKDLCYNTYEKSKADKIIDFMLNKVNSHQIPLTIDNIKSIGVDVNLLPKGFEDKLQGIHNSISKYLNDRNSMSRRLSLIASSSLCVVYEKKYNDNKNKISEGYYVVEEEDFMMKKKINNNEKKVTKGKNTDSIVRKYDSNSDDCYTDSYWDSYVDNCYRDSFVYPYGSYGDYYYSDYADDAYYDEYSDLSSKKNDSKEKKKVKSRVEDVMCDINCSKKR